MYSTKCSRVNGDVVSTNRITLHLVLYLTNRHALCTYKYDSLVCVKIRGQGQTLKNLFWIN